MFDLYVTICNETPKVMILDHSMLGARAYLQKNSKRDCPLMLFVKYDWIFVKTEQHRWVVSLNIEYTLDIPHNNQKRVDATYLLR